MIFSRLKQAVRTAANALSLKKSERMAALSLTLAIISSCFAVYQWWSSDRGARIRAAIELSNQYVEHIVYPQSIFEDYARGEKTFEDLVTVETYHSRLEYAAFLANQGLVDSDYFSQYLRCAIVKMANDGKNGKYRLSNETTVEAQHFATEQAKKCPVINESAKSPSE
jgi:hypothetical protein